MPIYEFLCPHCNRIFSFLALVADPERRPVCPRCETPDLTRVPSTFAVARKATGNPDANPSTGGDDARMAALEHEAMRMASELDERDAEDPRIMARMMRRLAEASGEPVTATMDEMFRRMEAGEDPEDLEEELGPQLEEEMEAEGLDDGGAGAPPTRDDGLYSM